MSPQQFPTDFWYPCYFWWNNGGQTVSRFSELLSPQKSPNFFLKHVGKGGHVSLSQKGGKSQIFSETSTCWIFEQDQPSFWFFFSLNARKYGTRRWFPQQYFGSPLLGGDDQIDYGFWPKLLFFFRWVGKDWRIVKHVQPLEMSGWIGNAKQTWRIMVACNYC